MPVRRDPEIPDVSRSGGLVLPEMENGLDSQLLAWRASVQGSLFETGHPGDDPRPPQMSRSSGFVLLNGGGAGGKGKSRDVSKNWPALSKVLQERGVPAAQFSSRANSALQAVGPSVLATFAVQHSRDAKCAWAALKQQCTDAGFRMIRQDELEQFQKKKGKGTEPNADTSQTSLPSLLDSDWSVEVVVDINGPQPGGVALWSEDAVQAYVKHKCPKKQGAWALVYVPLTHWKISRVRTLLSHTCESNRAPSWPCSKSS